jgi:hypothetical protein
MLLEYNAAKFYTAATPERWLERALHSERLPFGVCRQDTPQPENSAIRQNGRPGAHRLIATERE